MATNSSKRRASHEQPSAGAAPQPSTVSAEQRRAMIAEAAYYLNQRRIAAGELADEVADWLQAEQAIDQRITPFSSVHQHGKRVEA